MTADRERVAAYATRLAAAAPALRPEQKDKIAVLLRRPSPPVPRR